MFLSHNEERDGEYRFEKAFLLRDLKTAALTLCKDPVARAREKDDYSTITSPLITLSEALLMMYFANLSFDSFRMRILMPENLP
jgi:hypothetical protein